MKQSQLFTKTTKETPKDETSFNAQILIRAGFIDKVGAGMYNFLPLGLRVLNKINNIVREEMATVSGQEVLMTALTPKEVWQATDRWDNFDVLFKLTGNDDKEYALGATHEEIVTPLAKKFLCSYKEMPKSIFQIQVKFRNEKRAKAGLLRGREFIMKDMYSFHTDQADLDEYYETVKAAYFRIYERLGLKDLTYLTYSSGGAFSKFSHEFQTLTEAGEDHVYICPDCQVAVNREIIAEHNFCPVCKRADLTEAKAIEVGNIFKLGTKFSSAFDMKYMDQNGDSQEVIMGCYGMGPSRIMGTIVEVFNDERGIIWPESIAPFKIHLLSLKENKAATAIYQELINNNIEVLFDDREDVGAGAKFADADLIGCPYRLVVSSKTLERGGVELKARTSDQMEIIPLDQIINQFKR
ncbi:prolyl-tRNA synthetase [Candidatus Falkowbacteria bacterium CG10_big_fil_rev_8_21_14_0_10_39_9]|uniref:Proline--tRNA ligase n=1 Tax=Candidatus Falkowbacteria bacterium CG10_big_fil_rev_8_21_14_0_10_39_9 TaxID=1974566 RepID=A0A2M6WNE5_9BACT|nr:MAG: prolyl-tRNA synthetase [Candidatus Falkowbacteria bacterium CG10_big_fil_rev_8_21_14_0_10_39_9]